MMRADFFKKNRDRLLAQAEADLVVIAANTRLQRNGDTTLPFRQDSNFWYMSGIDEPDYILVLSQAKTYLIAPLFSKIQKVFDSVPDNTKLAHDSGINEILETRAGWQQLRDQVAKYKRVAVLPPANTRRHGFWANPARHRLLRAIKRLQSDVEYIDIGATMASLRAVKTADEISLIQQAINLTTDSFLQILTADNLSTLRYEYQVEAAFTHAFISNGATHAYQPIVAAGQHACTLHYSRNRARIIHGQCLLVDIGAEVSNYAADITRTVFVGGATARQQTVAKGVAAIQAAAYDLLRPGISIKDYEQQLLPVVADVLAGLGLINASKPSQQRHMVRQFMPHATSHFLGLDVHDAGSYEQPLAEGMVLTVEPGIYIPAENMGVRIEDNVLITKNGYTLLSKNLPPLLT